LLIKHQQISSFAAKKSRDFVLKAKQSIPVSPLEILDSPTSSTEAVPLLQTNLLENEIQFNETLIFEREQDLINIQQSIVEVNEIFRDLGMS
jgi:syntaxin 7